MVSVLVVVSVFVVAVGGVVFVWVLVVEVFVATGSLHIARACLCRFAMPSSRRLCSPCRSGGKREKVLLCLAKSFFGLRAAPVPGFGSFGDSFEIFP